MRIVRAFAQNTKEWHAWRSKGLGASDAPTIMGMSPWASAFELWLEKTGKVARREPNGFAAAAMQRGVALEPKAREWYERRMGMKMEVLSAIHDQYDFIRASFDGYNAEHNVVIEIKCPGKTSHAKTLKSRQAPENYMPQLQQQLMVSGAVRIDFVSYSGEDDGENVIIPVYPDPAYQAELLNKLINFWMCIQSGTTPELDKKDFPRILDQLLEDLKKVSNTANALEVLAQTMKKKEKK